ncbi:MAG TPA: hypothetical protein PLR18_01680 [bacterium]|nr:hypothetical protein [bacterium]
MKLYRFSPIENQDQLLQAIKYTHFVCHELCRKILYKYLFNFGNIGIFCHYDQEYELLTKISEELTDSTGSFNQKYFRLHQPMVIPAEGNVPETTYTHLYIRRPDSAKPQVGDVDFFLEPAEYAKLKNQSNLKGVRPLNRPDLDLIGLHDPDIDALAYVGTHKLN